MISHQILKVISHFPEQSIKYRSGAVALFQYSDW